MPGDPTETQPPRVREGESVEIKAGQMQNNWHSFVAKSNVTNAKAGDISKTNVLMAKAVLVAKTKARAKVRQM